MEGESFPAEVGGSYNVDLSARKTLKTRETPETHEYHCPRTDEKEKLLFRVNYVPIWDTLKPDRSRGEDPISGKISRANFKSRVGHRPGEALKLCCVVSE